MPVTVTKRLLELMSEHAVPEISQNHDILQSHCQHIKRDLKSMLEQSMSFCRYPTYTHSSWLRTGCVESKEAHRSELLQCRVWFDCFSWHAANERLPSLHTVVYSHLRNVRLESILHSVKLIMNKGIRPAGFAALATQQWTAVLGGKLRSLGMRSSLRGMNMQPSA